MRQQTVVGQDSQIHDLIADGDANPRCLILTIAKDPERQVLNREVALGFIRRSDPTLALPIIGRLPGHLIDVIHDFDSARKFFCKPCQHSKYCACNCYVSSAYAVGLMTRGVSNMKASVSSTLCGFVVSELDALRNVSASGPCPDMQLCRLAPPGTNPSSFASYAPCTRPMNSLATLRWNQGGRNVSSATSQRGGKMTKSSEWTPGVSLGDCSTRKIDGSGWS